MLKRVSILDSRKLRGSRIEFRVETVNLPLSGTVLNDLRLLRQSKVKYIFFLNDVVPEAIMLAEIPNIMSTL